MGHSAERRVPITIRRVTVRDARAIAEVHTLSWQWAYRGLHPDAMLDRMSDRLEGRVEMHWEPLAIESKEQYTWVIEDGKQIVGFASTMPSRDSRLLGFQPVLRTSGYVRLVMDRERFTTCVRGEAAGTAP